MISDMDTHAYTHSLTVARLLLLSLNRKDKSATPWEWQMGRRGRSDEGKAGGDGITTSVC